MTDPLTPGPGRESSGPLTLTKLHHACVVVASATTRLLVDPGSLGERPTLDGVDAILVTHDHNDHADPDVLAEAARRHIPIWIPQDARGRLSLDGPHLHSATAGETVTIGDMTVDVLGARHAEVHPEISGPDNHAYLIAGRVLVTGDEHPEVPAEGVEVVVTPVDAPWLRATDLIRFVRRARPRRVIGVHDGLLNADGLTVARSVLASLTREGVEEAYLPRVGETLRV